MTSPLPPRFTEAAFRFYEPFIATALSRHPEPTLINPAEYNLAGETFCCRFRDAMNSYHTNNWPSTKINRTLFIMTHPLLKVANRGSFIAIGTKDALKRLRAEAAPTVSLCDSAPAQPPLDLTELSPSYLELQGMATLAAARVITCPIRFKSTPAIVEALEANHDIAITHTSDDIYTMI